MGAIRPEVKKQRIGSTTYPFLIKLTNLTKPKLMKINVAQIYCAILCINDYFVLNVVKVNIFFTSVTEQ